MATASLCEAPMIQVNMHEAKTNLSKLVQKLSTYEEDVVIIANNGTPVAQITRIPAAQTARGAFGAAKDAWDLPGDWYEQFQALDSEVEALFESLQ